jgi:hypothetical protein
VIQTVNQNDATTLMLLAWHFLALGVAVMVFVWIIFLQRRSRAAEKFHHSAQDIFLSHATLTIRPTTWLAIRSLEPETVRAALPDKQGFLISPRVNGWVIVTGPDLPSPDEDIDACHLFLTALSRELGHVQFFYAEKFSRHHAWARMDDGCVTRAYAWAGETVWNQGAKTMAEIETGMKCFDYGENSEVESWRANERAAANLEKIPLLAARWSIDPAILHRADGITGESSRLY